MRKIWPSKSRSAAVAAAMWALGCPCAKAQDAKERAPFSPPGPAMEARSMDEQSSAPPWVGLRVSGGSFGDAGWTARVSGDPLAASGPGPAGAGSQGYGYAQAQWDLGARWPGARGWTLTARAERSGAGDPAAAGRAGPNSQLRLARVDPARGAGGLAISTRTFGAERAWEIGAGFSGSVGLAVAERTLDASAGASAGFSTFAASASSLMPWAQGKVSWVSQDGAWKAKAGAEGSQARDQTQWESEIGVERSLVSKPWGQVGVEGGARWSGVGVSRTYQMGAGQSVDVSLKARARTVSFGLFVKF